MRGEAPVNSCDAAQTTGPIELLDDEEASKPRPTGCSGLPRSHSRLHHLEIRPIAACAVEVRSVVKPLNDTRFAQDADAAERAVAWQEEHVAFDAVDVRQVGVNHAGMGDDGNATAGICKQDTVDGPADPAAQGATELSRGKRIPAARLLKAGVDRFRGPQRCLACPLCITA